MVGVEGGMMNNVCGHGSALVSALSALVSYEIVLNTEDFFISVNGPMVPSQCSGFSVDENMCLVFHHEAGNIISYPLPGAFEELITTSERVLVAKFCGGTVVDAKVLERVGGHAFH